MKKITKEKEEKILQQIAMEHFTTVDEVKREIKLGMIMGMCNQDPEIQKKWSEIPHDSLLSTEEFIIYLSTQVKKKN